MLSFKSLPLLCKGTAGVDSPNIHSVLHIYISHTHYYYKEYTRKVLKDLIISLEVKYKLQSAHISNYTVCDNKNIKRTKLYAFTDVQGNIPLL